MRILKRPKVSLLFDRRKQSSATKPGYIEIFIYLNPKRVRISTGVAVLPKQWKNDTVVKHEDSVNLNRLIQSQLDEVNRRIAALYAEGDDIDIDRLKGISFVSRMAEERKQEVANEKKGKATFIEWLNNRIALHTCRESTRRQHYVMARLLEKFGGIKYFEDLTTANIKKWDTFLHHQEVKSGDAPRQTTVHGYHKRLKPYIREAIELGLIEKDPYTSLHIARGKSDTRKYLTVQERDAIEALELKGTNAIARDMFIFACYTGLAYSDLVKITRDDVKQSGHIYYIEDKRLKTNSAYKITLLPKAVTILERYDFSMDLLSDQKCNAHLKIIAAMAGINKNLTFHMGRHTFATWALKSGVSIENVSKMLAHADITTTQIYAKVLQEDVDRSYELLMTKCN